MSGRLAGIGVVVTRPRAAAEPLAAALAREGARPIVFPALAIEDLAPGEALDRALDALPGAALAVFVSANAVEKGLAAARARGPWPEGVAVAAVGDATAEALRNSGFARVISPAERHDSEALLRLPELQALGGRTVVVFRGAGGREQLREALEARGATVLYAECYRRVRPDSDPGPLLAAWARGEVQAVSVLSAETLENFLALAGPPAEPFLARTALVVPHAAIAAHGDAGRFSQVLVAAHGTEGLIDALARLKAPQGSPMTDSPASPPPPARAGNSRRGADRTARALGLVALAVTAGAAWIAIDTRLAVRALESSAGTRLAELGAEGKGAKAALAQAQADLRDAQVRVAELEARVADTQEQRAALEEMYREISRSTDDRLLSEVEQMLVLASQQLQLAGNVRGALVALQAADQRLARAEKLAATPLRRAITQDMERLKSVPQLDTVGLAVKLDGLIAQVESLPLLIAESPPAARAARLRVDEERSFASAARDLWEEMKGLVKIRSLDTPEPQLLAPTQAYFLRENLKLRLLAARVSLLARDESTFREDVRAAQAWIAKYFDARSKAGAAALASLKQVADTPVAIGVPDINASLAAARTARAAREKR